MTDTPDQIEDEPQEDTEAGTDEQADDQDDITMSADDTDADDGEADAT